MWKTLALAGLLVTGTALAADKPPAPKASAKKVAPKSGALELSAEHKGKTVTVAANKNITIRLEGNITTGYAWEVKEITGEAVKSQGKPTYVNDKVFPPGFAGGSGLYITKLRAVKPGKSTVKLVYVRDENEKPDEENTFTVTIEVQKK